MSVATPMSSKVKSGYRDGYLPFYGEEEQSLIFKKNFRLKMKFLLSIVDQLIFSGWVLETFDEKVGVGNVS